MGNRQYQLSFSKEFEPGNSKKTYVPPGSEGNHDRMRFQHGQKIVPLSTGSEQANGNMNLTSAMENGDGELPPKGSRGASVEVLGEDGRPLSRKERQMLQDGKTHEALLTIYSTKYFENHFMHNPEGELYQLENGKLPNLDIKCLKFLVNYKITVNVPRTLQEKLFVDSKTPTNSSKLVSRQIWK